MKSNYSLLLIGAALSLSSAYATAGIVDPDCTAAKATVGVGGRCSPAEAVKDTVKDAAGIEEKGALEKRRDDDGMAKKAAKKVVK